MANDITDTAIEPAAHATFVHPSGKTTEVVGTRESVAATMQALAKAAEEPDAALPSLAAPSTETIAKAYADAGTLFGYRQALGHTSQMLRAKAAEMRAGADHLEAAAAELDQQAAGKDAEERARTQAAQAMLAACKAKG
jgi:hypothetical protein